MGGHYNQSTRRAPLCTASAAGHGTFGSGGHVAVRPLAIPIIVGLTDRKSAPADHHHRGSGLRRIIRTA